MMGGLRNIVGINQVGLDIYLTSLFHRKDSHPWH